jgi:hypothetical protein
MKSKKIGAGESPILTNEKVRREIQVFLRALESYPHCFSRDPGISFEEHRSKVESTKVASRPRTSNGR